MVWQQGSGWEVPQRLTCGRASGLQNPGSRTLSKQLPGGGEEWRDGHGEAKTACRLGSEAALLVFFATKPPQHCQFSQILACHLLGGKTHALLGTSTACYFPRHPKDCPNPGLLEGVHWASGHWATQLGPITVLRADGGPFHGASVPPYREATEVIPPPRTLLHTPNYVQALQMGNPAPSECPSTLSLSCVNPL